MNTITKEPPETAEKAGSSEPYNTRANPPPDYYERDVESDEDETGVAKPLNSIPDLNDAINAEDSKNPFDNEPVTVTSDVNGEIAVSLVNQESAISIGRLSVSSVTTTTDQSHATLAKQIIETRGHIQTQLAT